ncbi:MAG: 3-dehydroquinate synthase [Balneolaceae bacterium]
MMHKTCVTTTTKKYDVLTGSDILESSLRHTLKEHATDTLFIFIDENVNKYHRVWLDKILQSISDDMKVLIVPEGESSKSISFYSKAVDFLLQNRVRRNTPLIVIGGGVTGDLGGFAAATVLRGIPLIHIPTTLLAMVDSSIGGKTGINHSVGKNLIGSFYQPDAVIADIRFLSSLPRNEWFNGLSEILKYGAIHDSDIFNRANIFLTEDLIKIDSDKLISLIGRCVEIKAEIVGHDEHESGIRAYLNFGHTFAHALEKACDYDKISHGEAVYLGMLAACKLSTLTGGTLTDDFIVRFRSLYKYRVAREEVSSDNLLRYMQSDKKRTGVNLTFILLKSWQEPTVKTVADDKLIIESLEVLYNELDLNQI